MFLKCGTFETEEIIVEEIDFILSALNYELNIAKKIDYLEIRKKLIDENAELIAQRIRIKGHLFDESSFNGCTSLDAIKCAIYNCLTYKD